jgi:glycosyltransferase involved in cell wall biosynthesis
VKILALASTFHRSYGGPAVTVPALYNALANNGMEVTLISFKTKTGDNYEGLNNEHIRHICIENISINKLNVFEILKFKRKLAEIMKNDKYDLMHCHEIWLPVKNVFQRAAFENKIPYVVTPHGSLTKWCIRSKRLKKASAWYLYQKANLENAAVIHATSFIEAEDLRSLGLKTPIAIVKNGVDPFKLKDLKRIRKTQRKHFLYLSRLDPKKGLETLLDAYSELRPKNWDLNIVGPGDDLYVNKLKNIIQKKGLGKRVCLLGPAFGMNKIKAYTAADVFVLPTHSENFGIVIAEALSAGLPVITTLGTPWSSLITKKCGWWIADDKESVKKAMLEAMDKSETELRSMGRRGQKYIREEFSRSKVGLNLISVYEWIKGKGKKPEFVYFRNEKIMESN